MSASDLDEVGLARVTAMINTIRAAGLTSEAEMFSIVYWGWLNIARAYVCAHPYVANPESPSMTPISALGVVDSSFEFWGEQIPGTPKLDDDRVRRETDADEAWHHEEERRMRRDAGEEI